MPDATSKMVAKATRFPRLPALTTFCGRLGELAPVGEPVGDVVPGESSVGEGCWVWRTDKKLLQCSEVPAYSSLLAFACDVAELYHQRRVLQLSEVPGVALEVIWLELAADNALLVFLKSAPRATCL